MGILDLPQDAFGELMVYATHKSSRCLVKHYEATEMLQKQVQEEQGKGQSAGLTMSLKNNRDKNQFLLSANKSNGEHSVLCVIVSAKNGKVTAMTPVLAIYRHEKEFPPQFGARVYLAFRVLLEEAQRSPENVISPQVTAASLLQCWADVLKGTNDAEIRDHPCFHDLQLVYKMRQNLWIGHDDGREWIDRGLWNPFKDRKTQLEKVEEAITPSVEERRNDDPRTVYCLPYLDMKHEKIMWFCWTDYGQAKRYFLSVRHRPPSNPYRNTWMVTTANLLENTDRPPVLLKLPLKKAAKESVPS